MNIDELLKAAVEKEASDLCLVSGVPPVVRINGKLAPLKEQVLSPETCKELIYSILSPGHKASFEEKKELDISYEIPRLSRFRVNVHFEKGTVAASLRTIPTNIPSIDNLNLPQTILDFSTLPRGLVLLTGPTGSGKSTTLAVLIDQINSSRASHIITIEDPIEYLHSHKKSVIEQRELGPDTLSFAEALRHVLRQDPDVILVGEMRDLETISTAITAAETGHLVFSTLHTNDSVQAVDRIIDVFPPHQQQQIRLQLSMALQGIVAQQLLPKADGSGVVPAIEILKVTSGVRNIIRKAATAEIYSMIEIGGKYGMKTMDTSLKELYKKRLITRDEALLRAVNYEQLSQTIDK